MVRTPARASALALKLTIALAFLGVTLLPAAPPSLADHTPDHESIARLQVILKSIHVEDDQDYFGEGEIEGTVSLMRCTTAMEACSIVGSPYGLMLDFNADSGDTVTFDRILPGMEADGFPVYPGDRFKL